MSSKKMSLAIKQDSSSSYDRDFYKWTISQSSLLKKGKLDKIDIPNLIEEIESLGNSDKRTIRSHLINLILHMLRVQYQPKKHTKSWDPSISNARTEIMLFLEYSPSLKSVLKESFDASYEIARKKAAQETKLAIKKFPDICPWKLEEILNK